MALVPGEQAHPAITVSTTMPRMTLQEKLLPQPPSFQKKLAYEIHEELGKGTFGKVLRATWTRKDGSKLDVALKVRTITYTCRHRRY
ncbi:hypothetical protein BN14_10560 [Rhizoctonia solani AG-1 IB]|uniref:Serine-threonine/tyrosine-protein kinase catalytic domain-containing protein n=1 Tax=Thanatephorus cucumeris (strain AG1-IB / isolate 7/3/14) TaxID=1108050 RepID=M5CAH7_THACB|nr:hypothetical protein BN14_10560 [Rhizoctonia solani AG-1 IB]